MEKQLTISCYDNKYITTDVCFIQTSVVIKNYLKIMVYTIEKSVFIHRIKDKYAFFSYFFFVAGLLGAAFLLDFVVAATFWFAFFLFAAGLLSPMELLLSSKIIFGTSNWYVQKERNSTNWSKIKENVVRVYVKAIG